MKVHIKKKEGIYEFFDKRKIDIIDFWEWKEIFFNAGNLHDILRNEKDDTR